MDIPIQLIVDLLKKRKIMLQIDLSFEKNWNTSYELEKNEKALEEVWVVQFWRDFLSKMASKNPKINRSEYELILAKHVEKANILLHSLEPPIEISPDDDQAGHVRECDYCRERYERAVAYHKSINGKNNK